MRGRITHGLVTPAYGKTYGTIAEAKQDFMKGKDFLLRAYVDETGPQSCHTYCSIRDFVPNAIVTIAIENSIAIFSPANEKGRE
jgi:hypothetical protein